MSSSNAGSQLFGDEDPFVIVNLDEDVTVTSAPQKKKKKRIVKVGDRAKSKKAKTDVPLKETAPLSVETVPVATESMQKTAPETGPSRVPPGVEKGNGPLEGEVIVLPPQLFEGGPSVAVHTFNSPPSIECPILEEFAVQLNEADSLWLASNFSDYVVNVLLRAERDEALFEVVTLEEKVRQVQAKEAEIAEMQAKYDELDEKMKSFASLHISKEELHQWCTAFMYKMMSTCGMAAALEEDPKKTMHEAMVKVLTRLSLEQLPLWGALTGAMSKMSSPAEIAWFPGDVPAILAKGPSEEDPIPDVPDEYMGMSSRMLMRKPRRMLLTPATPGFRELLRMPLRPIPRTLPMILPLIPSQAVTLFMQTSLSIPLLCPLRSFYDVSALCSLVKQGSWTIHLVHHMVLSEEQSREFPLYSMISGILRSRVDVHSLDTVVHLENDLLDAMRTHNVKANQHLINEIKGLCEEMQRREVQCLRDHSDSLTFEAEIHEER
ncbi:OLC1v1035881C1 [Oldenlandia corymbosa var. corymbosa]|uniref:OLC1v1035881C1 n=1 Tax=Oldenlandia corymbosa var. corymbosa TaxID=529605 RepID=A0AAV1CUM0_OLDCO|nr:OLC1v1035881C1 [Oldenlandia corymbosa var. corymbosa]